MNILVIGNGFDLAHGLPTRYTDFLKFCKKVDFIYTSNSTASLKQYEMTDNYIGEINTYIDDKLKEAFCKADYTDSSKSIDTVHTIYPRLDEFHNLIEENFWIKYFMENNLYLKENWIDFENEISNVIQELTELIKNNKNIENEDVDKILKNNTSDTSRYILRILHQLRIISSIRSSDKLKDFIKILIDDLNKLIRALEIYLTDFVGEIKLSLVSPDINEIVNSSIEEQEELIRVLSFNYTNTYEKLYKEIYDSMMLDENLDDEEYSFEKYIDYIHGKADTDNTIESNNMVLGIDEFLSKKRKNKELEFITFKKYYQRIYKKTGSKYKFWVREIEEDAEIFKANVDEVYPIEMLPEDYPEIHNLYIFGHSLDVTDRDILRDLILNDNVYTTIFYVNESVHAQQIANLVKVIGQDELIRRTGGSTKTIEFKLQAEMKKR